LKPAFDTGFTGIDGDMDGLDMLPGRGCGIDFKTASAVPAEPDFFFLAFKYIIGIIKNFTVPELEITGFSRLFS
jgi:hypothetical protein